MAEEYKDYLAARILTENRPVTYRLLSRALKVDVNTAKCMLFEFHQKQNAKKPNSVHATYLLSGTKRRAAPTKATQGRHGEDVDMRSSPFMSSMPERVEFGEDSADDSGDETSDETNDELPKCKTTIIQLISEEELEDLRAEFDEEFSIHVYSLEPSPLENLNLLSSCTHELITEYADQDPLQRWRTYGTIHNPYIKRRTAKSAAIATSAPVSSKPALKPAAKPASKPVEKPAAKPSITSQLKETSTLVRQGSASEDNTSGRSTSQPPAGGGTLKRSDSRSGAKKSQTAGALFKSFAKTKPKTKDAETSRDSTPPPEDEPMLGMSEDEGDGDDDDEPVVKVDEEKNEAARKAREARQEKLRGMFDDDDEIMPDAPSVNDSQPEATPAATPDADLQGEPTVTVQNGRRRGRRRVIKKKKVKDDEGYLVTKEETVWESFSEDEPEPKRAKPAPVKPSNAAKGKPAAKKGQGSIASFFKKA